MQRDLHLYLLDIVGACDAIERFIAGKTLSSYEQDDLIKAAVERKFEIIGEAIRQARHHYPELRQELAAERQIVAFRNRVIHGYFDLNDEVVWSVAQNYLAPLRKEVRLILDSLPY